MAVATDSRPSGPALADPTDLPDRDPLPAGAPSPVDAVVFDLGNVLITWDPYPAIARTVGPTEATRLLADEGFDFASWNQQQDAGRSWDEAEAAAAISHPQWEVALRGYRTNFKESLVGAIEDTVQILRELHAAGIPMYGLTNWSAETFPVALERFDFLQLFEDIVVSGQERVAKPDPKIFEILRDRIGHSLDHCIFIDDGARNVEAAAKAGLDAILFTDTGHLREDLVVRGLPLAPA